MRTLYTAHHIYISKMEKLHMGSVYFHISQWFNEIIVYYMYCVYYFTCYTQSKLLL